MKLLQPELNWTENKKCCEKDNNKRARIKDSFFCAGGLKSKWGDIRCAVFLLAVYGSPFGFRLIFSVETPRILET